MASGRVNDELSCNSNDISSFDDIHVLLVDDDAVTLAIVGAILRGCSYEVMTTNSPHHALEILRGKKDWFDLVVCDLHMPVMNGFELLIKIKEEFQLPVIMISVDDDKSVISKSLQYGASFYLTKPIKKDDVKNLWQYAVASKKERPVVAEGIGMGQQNQDENLSNKRKPASDDTGDQLQEAPVLNKKKRMVWTSSLHDLFLDAIKQIGLRSAVPKTILELMNVPGLTRAHVSSHLQKYRVVLRRLGERGSSNSCFAAGVSPQLLGNSPTTVRQSFGKQPLLACQGRQFVGSMEPNMYASQDQPIFPNLQQTSSTINSMLQLQYDKSSDAPSGAQLLFPNQLQACNSTSDSVNDALAGTNVMNTCPDMTHANPSSLDGANKSRRQQPVANPRSPAAGPMNCHITSANSNLIYVQAKQNLGSVGIANLGWNSNPPLSNNTSGYMVEEGSSSGRGSQSASQFLPAEVTKLPTQVQQQYGAGNSGGISDIVTSSMVNVDNTDEEELDDEELIRYFLHLESNASSNNNEQLARDILNQDYVRNQAEMPNIDGYIPNHLLGSNEAEPLLNIQPQGTSMFMDSQTSTMYMAQNAGPISNPSPQQDWDMERLKDMPDPNM